VAAVVDHLAVEVELLGVRAGDLVPELDETHQFAVLIEPGQVGVSVAQAAARLLQREEGEHAGAGLASSGQIMAVQRQGGDHLRAGIPRLGDEAVEAEPGQKRHEEEESHDSRMERTAGREAQLSAVGDFGRFGAWLVLAGACPEWSSASVGEKRGVVTPPRQSARRRLTTELRAEGL
jgi:hypothetical protein